MHASAIPVGIPLDLLSVLLSLPSSAALEARSCRTNCGVSLFRSNKTSPTPKSIHSDYGECSKSVIFEFKEPIVIIERSGPLQERHWLELIEHRATRIAKIDGELS